MIFAFSLGVSFCKSKDTVPSFIIRGNFITNMAKPPDNSANNWQDLPFPCFYFKSRIMQATADVLDVISFVHGTFVDVHSRENILT